MLAVHSGSNRPQPETRRGWSNVSPEEGDPVTGADCVRQVAMGIVESRRALGRIITYTIAGSILFQNPILIIKASVLGLSEWRAVGSKVIAIVYEGNGNCRSEEANGARQFAHSKQPKAHSMCSTAGSGVEWLKH